MTRPEENANVSCEWFEASIAAGLYEPLPQEEQSRLEAHLAVCGACRETQAELGALVASIPTGEVEMPVDLWTPLSARIAPRKRFHWSLYAAAALLLAVIGANVARNALPKPEAAAPMAQASPVAQGVALAKNYVADRDFTKALKTLQGTLSAHAKDADAGQAQLALAELEFSHGQRYAEAYEAYAALKSQYPQTFAAAALNADRFDLLSEAKAANFQPLYELDAAKSSADPFAQLERIAARPDGTLVAALAVDAMRQIVGGPDSAAGAGRVAALEKVRDRCKDPVAAAQIKMALADAHWTQLHDAATARSLYGEVANAPQPLVAQAAKAALAKLEVGR